MKTALALAAASAFNDASFQPDLGPGLNPVGAIMVANEARFTSAHFSTPLTAYAAGYRDPLNLDAILDRIAPVVPVSRRFEFKKADNAQAFLSDIDDIRAIGSAFKRVEYTGESVNEKTLNKGLTTRVDHDDVADDNWREQKVAMLQQRILRNELRRAIASINAGASNTAVNWVASTPNPDKDIRAALLASADITGIRPNVVLIGDAAWEGRRNAYEALNTPKAGKAADMTPQQLATSIMVDLVEVLTARYQVSATAKAQIVSNLVFSYLAQQGVSKDDPSAVKRFTSPARGGGRWGVYVQEYEKFTDISVELYSNIVVTGTGIQKLTVTLS